MSRSESRSETTLEMAARHVRDAETKVARQRALLNQLIRNNRSEMAVQAEASLVALERFRELAVQHLAFERSKSPR